MNVQMNRHAMSYGLLMGVIFSINFYIATIPSIAFLQYINAIIIIFITYKLAVHCRDKAMGGVIGYGSALWYIIDLYLYASMILALFKYLFYKFIKPDFLIDQLNQSVQILQQTPLASSITPELYESMASTLTPLNVSVQSIWINVVYGLLVGLIMAAAVKKEKSIFEE